MQGIVVDGKKIAADLAKRLRDQVIGEPKLVVFLVGEDPASASYIRMKQNYGESIGVAVELRQLPTSTTAPELEAKIQEANADVGVQGMIVQLPAPNIPDIQLVLNTIASHKDPDVLSETSREAGLVVPPVAGAVAHILQEQGISLAGRKVVLIGRGKLVGAPVASWLHAQGIHPTILDENTSDVSSYTKEADIVISGAGEPGLLKPEILKKGAILIDAGTSEQSGKLAGDADPACAEVVSLFTPVPGGVGPVAVAMLFANLLTLSSSK